MNKSEQPEACDGCQCQSVDDLLVDTNQPGIEDELPLIDDPQDIRPDSKDPEDKTSDETLGPETTPIQDFSEAKITPQVKSDLTIPAQSDGDPGTEKANEDPDLVHRINGMFRLLDLISEQGSGGLVDKVIIAQDHVERFINTLSPGAYRSLTKIDFKRMDHVHVKPLGVYGSKEEIVRFLRQLGTIDETTANLMLAVDADPTGAPRPHLRSGLYVLTFQKVENEQRLFVIFWPENTTWDGDVSSAVRRNRTAFMRYLTKITDQTICLISDEHSAKLVLDNSDTSMPNAFGKRQSGRLSSFKVKKAVEQQEDVKFGQGFSIKLPHTSTPDVKPPIDIGLDEKRLRTRIVGGDCRQAIMKVDYVPGRLLSFKQLQGIIPPESFLGHQSVSVRLRPSLSDETIQRLTTMGLPSAYNSCIEEWQRRNKDTRAERKRMEYDERDKMRDMISGDAENVENVLEWYIIRQALQSYPHLNSEKLRGGRPYSSQEQAGYFKQLVSLFPKIECMLSECVPPNVFSTLEHPHKAYKEKKTFVISYLSIVDRGDLSDAQKNELFERIESNDTQSQERLLAHKECVLAAGHKPDILHGECTGTNKSNDLSGQKKFTQMWKTVSTYLSTLSQDKTSREDDESLSAREFASRMTDEDFTKRLYEMDPQVRTRIAKCVEETIECVHEVVSLSVQRKLGELVQHVNEIKSETFETNIRLDLRAREKMERSRSKQELMDALQTIYRSDKSRDYIVEVTEPTIEDQNRRCDYKGLCFDITAEPHLRYTLLPLTLTEADRQDMKSDPSYIPTPQIPTHHSTSFNLPISCDIAHIQLLECGSGKCLLVVDTGANPLYVYLEDHVALDGAVRERKFKKRFLREKLGRDVSVAFDERKRLLVLCGIDNKHSSFEVYSYIFDEKYEKMMRQGSSVNLRQWYDEVPRVHAMLLIAGTDEVAFVEATGKVRLFSLITQQFRPKVLQLEGKLISAHSTPDDSCLVTLVEQGNSISLGVYHWASLGLNSGFKSCFLLSNDATTLITSFGQRNNVHLVTINSVEGTCSSLVMSITKPTTEFQLRAANTGSTRKVDRSNRNGLVECHAEVWLRFPIAPVVRRQAITFDVGRRTKHILFVSSQHRHRFESFFQSMIRKFERDTRKPSDGILAGISVRDCSFLTAIETFEGGPVWDTVSVLRSGEWTVEIFCLIPIHIAVAKDNRFVPLRDGVWTPEAEKTLLGAEIGRVVDYLSFGWYESIFQSYLSTKHVKVVSSMGEQSVGKSFALNHLVDTSFAGSAMRTTEGVWMSIAPTEDCLLVALDFEGVHSIERTAQEDALLVLFNAAISNLVLFRNNFALSRDITDLFQSFQTSSSVLDPDANPTLFRSTLVVIIKDVVDSDKEEITREFQLKLQSIVEQEQENNFITRLHRGNLEIIPWPVIESELFYTLFTDLYTFLEEDTADHEAAGTFLHKLKMLMAKLRINDWGSLSQNMASHRAQLLLHLLPIALAYGATETDPEIEPLKDLDTDLEILPHSDSQAVFWVSKPHEGKHGLSKEEALRGVYESWTGFGSRASYSDSEWIKGLSDYINDSLTHRIEHVQAWVNSNVRRFTNGNASMEELHRSIDAEIVEMKRATRLCKTRCNRCHLFCLSLELHDGEHNCQTDHTCKNLCEFEHDAQESCALLAGHSGDHICNVVPHLCGKPCFLDGKSGCQKSCMKVARHDNSEKHLCLALKHACSKPCALKDVITSNGHFSCPGTCDLSWDSDHVVHICAMGQSCPISCQLCRRLCAVPDHLHGLNDGELHLCGQEHKCYEKCAAKGICQIDTVPHSIETTFDGRYDRFQYTKYTQDAKKLPCSVLVPPWEVQHQGPHTHDTRDDAFHFCEVRCGACSYYCTLKYDHPQTEHSTNHGSMIKTQWVIDGPDGTDFELDGHRFGSSDEGAPMMCNITCRSVGRHLHIEYCRTSPSDVCNEPGTQHIIERLVPDPKMPKDWITHDLYWKRLGFRDPYTKEEQAEFSKCDAMCPSLEHKSMPSKPAQPSYCTLPMFHKPQDRDWDVKDGYISTDGHHFSCKNPVAFQPNFHVMFVIDKSGSMSLRDRKPLRDHPTWSRISRSANNRLGAVFQAIHSFLSARERALISNYLGAVKCQYDAYSAILFDQTANEVFTNVTGETPDNLLTKLLDHRVNGGTDFNGALRKVHQVMDTHWNSERVPVVIFLSDGEQTFDEKVMEELCNRSKSLGKAVSFHAVSFGKESSSWYLRRMVEIARGIQNASQTNTSLHASTIVESSYSDAIDTIKLSETFLDLERALRKPRGSLLRMKDHGHE